MEEEMQLFMENLKGVVSLFLVPQDIEWTEELAEQTSHRLRLMEGDIFRADINDNLRQCINSLSVNVKFLHCYTKSFKNSIDGSSTDSYATQNAQRESGEGPGRPSLNATMKQKEFLWSMHFSWEKIAVTSS